MRQGRGIGRSDRRMRALRGLLLRKQGRTVAEVAAELGVSHMTVHRDRAWLRCECPIAFMQPPGSAPQGGAVRAPVARRAG